MTIRSRLNIAMLAMFCMLLLTAGTVNYAVTTITTQALSHARMRELAVLTDDIRAEIFYQTAVVHGFQRLRSDEDWWPQDVLDDVDVRINLSADDAEKRGWMRVREDIHQLAGQPHDERSAADLVRDADNQLRKLRREYNRRLADAVAATAQVSSNAQIVVVVTALASAMLFLIATLLIRDWLVKPIETLNRAADEIGAGNLHHRVDLAGKDEFARLGQRLDMMAERLADHQKQLLEAREMAAIGEVCTNIAHGLRNPLAGMRAGAQLAARRVGDHDTLRAMLNDIVAEVDRMDERITQLFEFSRIVQLDRQVTTFAEVAEDALAEARSIIKDRQITVETRDESAGRTWPIDRRRIASVIGELIVNAAHHSEPGSAVVLSGEAAFKTNGAPPVLHITVVDHGVGIQPTALKRLFDLFYTTRPGGTGLGLPLAARVVARHGGTIEVSSVVGQGTRVDVTI